MKLERNPTLETVLMVEEALKKNGGQGPYQIWKEIPRKMSYQTFKTIIKYLIDSGKVLQDREGHLAWVYDPKIVRYYLSRKELLWRG